MKRTAILKRSTPLKSGGILKRSGRGMKSSRPKSTPIRASARDQECTLRFDCCNGRTDTTVLCHSNLLSDGKGMGLKAPDLRACYGCLACHDVLDGRAPRPDGLTYKGMLARFEVAVRLTHQVLQTNGLLPATKE